QHRDLVRVRHRLRRGPHHAQEVSERRTPVPLSGRAAGADPRHPDVPAPDVLAAGGQLVAFVRLAGDRPADLFLLRPEAQRDVGVHLRARLRRPLGSPERRRAAWPSSPPPLVFVPAFGSTTPAVSSPSRPPHPWHLGPRTPRSACW